jgi:cytochrome c biogenesis protein CcdA/thiol-disulfide isomerase/thioredoxin
MRIGRLALLALAGLTTLGLGQIGTQDVPAVVTPVVESPTVRPGSTVRLALLVEVPEGFHLQSNQPRDPTLIPTTLTFDPPPGVTPTEVVFPPATDFIQEGSPDPLAVFEHEFYIGIELGIDEAQPPGEAVLPARLRYQACDDTVCFRPRTVDTAWTFLVTPDASEAAGHRDVFAGIAFGTGEPAVIGPLAPDEPAPTATGRDDAGLARLDDFTVAGVTEGYRSVEAFSRFIADAEAGIVRRGWFEDRGVLAILAITALGGLALNLTPCVLPMIPINIAIIGAGAQAGRRRRGLVLGSAYGAAMAIVYGALGLIVILTAGTFGTINASPWFNLGIAVLFVVLALAMFDVIAIDFSKLGSRIRFDQGHRGTLWLAFGMGSVAALLAGACVAPVVIQVVVFASDLYARGTTIALALPFFLGLGMALPWPLAGAGMALMPKPGRWMVRVKQAIGLFILATALYYGYVAYGIFENRRVDPASVAASVQAKLDEGWYSSLEEGLAAAETDGSPVLIDLWATWCKNCLVMDDTTLADPSITAALEGYTKIKFQAEDPSAYPASELMQRVGSFGLPTYVILKPN